MIGRGGVCLLLLVCCVGWTTALTTQQKAQWEAAEHKHVGETAMERLRQKYADDWAFQEGKVKMKGKQGTVVTMKIGELVAAQGDFFTHPKLFADNICYAGIYSVRKDKAEEWLNGIMQGLTVDEQEWFQIKLIMGTEERALASLKPGESPETAFTLSQVKDYSRVTHNPPLGRVAESDSAANTPLSWVNDIAADPGRFMTLSYNNVDHFGVDDCNGKAYRALHDLAMDAAKKARVFSQQPQTKHEAEHFRNRAWVAEGMALHYLTDMFAAGHIRTPRAKLKQQCPDVDKGAFSKWFKNVQEYLTAIASVADLVYPRGEFKQMLKALQNAKGTGPGDLIAKCMHAEDNHLGLSVKNELGDEWVAYGDALYMAADRNSDNAKVAEAACMRSMEEIYANIKYVKLPPPQPVLNRLQPRDLRFHVRAFDDRETESQERQRLQSPHAQMYFAIMKLLGFFNPPESASVHDPDGIDEFPDFVDFLQEADRVHGGADAAGAAADSVQDEQVLVELHAAVQLQQQARNERVEEPTADAKPAQAPSLSTPLRPGHVGEMIKKFMGNAEPPAIPPRVYRALRYVPYNSIVQKMEGQNYPPMVLLKNDTLYARDPFSESEMAASGNKYHPTYQRELKDDPRLCFSLAIVCMMDQGANTIPWSAAPPGTAPKPLDKQKLRALARSAVGRTATAAWKRLSASLAVVGRKAWDLLVSGSE